MHADLKTNVLIVDDNPLDVRMISAAFAQQSSWSTQLAVADDGEEAIRYLLQQHEFSDATKPDLVILDLNLPKQSGTEVLRVIRSDDKLSQIPVVILSSSPQSVFRDMADRDSSSANLYLSKPSSVKSYLAMGSIFRKCYEEAAGPLARTFAEDSA